MGLAGLCFPSLWLDGYNAAIVTGWLFYAALTILLSPTTTPRQTLHHLRRFVHVLTSERRGLPVRTPSTMEDVNTHTLFDYSRRADKNSRS